MKKIWAICAFIIFPALLFAQQGGFIQFKADINLKDKGREIKLLKGEILPLASEDGNGKMKVFFESDTLKLTDDKSKIDKLAVVKTDHSADRSQFVFYKPGHRVFVDLLSLAPYVEPVRFVTEDQKSIIVDKDKGLTLKSLEAGRHMRLVIPGSPTLFYDYLALDDYQIKSKHKMSNNPGQDGDGFFSNLGAAQIIIFILILLSILGTVYWWLFGRKKAIRVAVYKKLGHDQGLEHFVNQNEITIRQLVKYNKDIKQNFLTLPGGEQKAIVKTLRGKDLIVGYERKKIENQPVEDPSLQNSPAENPSAENTQGNVTHTDPQHRNPFETNRTQLGEPDLLALKNIESLLRSMESNIIRKINDQNSNEHYAQEIKTLQSDLDNSIKENERLTEKNGQLEGEKNRAENDFYAEQDKSNVIQQTMNLLQEKIIPTDFLREYGRQVIAMINLINSIVKKASDCFQLFEGFDNQESQVVARLLLKFEKNRSGVIQNWQQIIQEIVTHSVTTDTELKRALKDFPQNTDKADQFRHLLFDEMLARETSAVLILSEEFRNLGKFFSSPSDSVIQTQNKFQYDSDQLMQKSSAVGLTPQYVTLFEKYTNFLTLNKSLTQPVSAAYRHIGKFEKDTIIEICEFGFKTHFNETDTLVILSKYE